MFLRFSNVFMAALFLVATIVQYNDPDGLFWMVFYLSAAGICAFAAAKRLSWVAPALVGFVGLVGAALLASDVLGNVQFAQLFEAWTMHNLLIEEGREMGGFLIVAVWMLVLSIATFRQRHAAPSPAS